MNCQIHPFKQCSFYNKKEDRLQCPLCLLPSDLQQQVIDNTTKPLSQNSIIDIDLVESLAQSLIQEEDCYQDLNKLESHCFNILQEFQLQIKNYLEQLCQSIQDNILQQLYKLRILAEQQQADNEENQKLLKNIQDMKKSDQNSCIESLTSLQSQLTKIDKITHQKVQQLQMKISFCLDEFMKNFQKCFAQQDVNLLNKNLTAIFEQKEQQIQKTNEAKSVNSSMTSQSGNISVEQIKKITIQHQHQSKYQASSILVLEGQIILGTKCGKIILYDYSSFSEISCVEQAHKDQVKILSRGKNDKTFISSGNDRFIKIWEKQHSQDINNLSISLKFDLEQQVSLPLCITVCDRIRINNQKEVNLILVGSSDNTVRIWNLDNGQYLYTYSGHQGDVYCVAFVNKLNVVASGSQDKTIRLWDGINYKYSRHIFKFTGHMDSVLGLVSLPEENQILSGGLDKTLRLWDCDKKVQIKVISTQFMIQKLILFQPGVVVTQSSDSRIRFYDYRINIMLHDINNQRKNVINFCVDNENKSIQAINENNVNLFF